TRTSPKVTALTFRNIALEVGEGTAPLGDSHKRSRRGPEFFYLIVLMVLLVLSVGSGVFAWKAGEFAHIVAPADSGSSRREQQRPPSPAPQGGPRAPSTGPVAP